MIEPIKKEQEEELMNLPVDKILLKLESLEVTIEKIKTLQSYIKGHKKSIKEGVEVDWYTQQIQKHLHKINELKNYYIKLKTNEI